MPSIKEKLAFFDKKSQSAAQISPPAADDGSEELGLLSIDGDGGKVLLREKRVLYSQFDAYDLSAFIGLTGNDFSLIGKNWIFKNFHPQKILLFDTETTGLAGGSGTYIFLAGVTRFFDDHALIRQYVMPDQSFEKPFLRAIVQEIADCEGLITFNGKSYDLPLLKTRCIMNRMSLKFDSPHLDLLHTSRRLFRSLLSFNLNSLEENILRVRREDDVPGYLIPGLYFETLRTGDLRPIKPVLQHNAMDLLSLAGVAVKAADSFRHAEGRPARELVSVMRTLAALNLLEQAATFGDVSMEDAQDSIILLLHKARYLKKMQKLDDAAAIWQRVVVESRPLYLEPYIELAKYYEHRCQDAKMALYYVDKVETRFQFNIELHGEEGGEHAVMQDIARRKARLLRKAHSE